MASLLQNIDGALLPPITRIFLSLPCLFIDDTLGPELAVELRVEALTALFDFDTLAAFLAEACLVFLTDGNRLPLRMVSASHLTISTDPQL